MLVLSRKQGELIHIGPDVSLKVMRISGGRVRIAIEAPEHIRITRGELVEPTLRVPATIVECPVPSCHPQAT